MNRRSSRTLSTLTVALVPALLVPSGAASASGTSSSSPAVPTLVAIRAAHHPGYDRLVFQFAGRTPAQRSVRYVSRVITDPKGTRLTLHGSAFLNIRFFAADAHTQQGNPTYRPSRQTFALPDLVEVAQAGDFENVLSFGVGVARREPVHMFTLTGPSRVVLDIATPFRTTPARVFFQNQQRFATGREPYVRGVSRSVIPPRVATGALQRLFAGPTLAEKRAHLRFVSSGATGFRNLTISGGIARVRLTGRCSSGGSTFTVANEIFPTLKQFPSVKYVKIYDSAGRTERPNGRSDSIPESLEP